MLYFLRVGFFSILLFQLLSCTNKESKSCENNDALAKHLLDSLEHLEAQKINQVLSVKYRDEMNLLDVQSLNKDIQVDLKYAGTDNFMKIKLYDKITNAYLQKDVAERLARCQVYLTNIDSQLHLLVYDAVRPVSVQQKMWDALDTIPVSDRTKFVSNPANGSIHNYGAAVDLTICDANGTALDMGAGYDDIREIAYPRLEEEFLASGELTKEQVENRKLLRKVMASQKFTNIETEWWHFNACSRVLAKEKYSVMNEE
jgi:D-alanyl-D-alanine dipeptidase